MFCPNCEQEFEINGDQLKALALKAENMVCPLCKEFITIGQLEDWVMNLTKTLKKEEEEPEFRVYRDALIEKKVDLSCIKCESSLKAEQMEEWSAKKNEWLSMVKYLLQNEDKLCSNMDKLLKGKKVLLEISEIQFQRDEKHLENIQEEFAQKRNVFVSSDSDELILLSSDEEEYDDGGFLIFSESDEEIANLETNSSLLLKIDEQLGDQSDELIEQIDSLDGKEAARLTDEQETLGGQIYLLEEWLKWFGRKKELLEKTEEPSEKDKDWFRASDAWFKAVDIVLNKRENENEVIQNDLDLESDVHIIPTSSDSYTWEKVLHYVKANLDGLVN